MRMTERLTGLKAWFEKELCEGRQMKAPAPDFDISKITTQEPRVYLAWSPTRTDTTGTMRTDPGNICPGIIIMPNASHSKYVEEKRFDRYNNVSRPQEMGQQISISILFSVYEPGVRLPGFIESVEAGHADMSLLQEGTEQGLFTLINWMDDAQEKMLGTRIIPGTDMFLDESTMVYSLYTDQEYVVDRRPIYYGFINASYYGFATEKTPSDIENFLK